MYLPLPALGYCLLCFHSDPGDSAALPAGRAVLHTPSAHVFTETPSFLPHSSRWPCCMEDAWWTGGSRSSRVILHTSACCLWPPKTLTRWLEFIWLKRPHVWGVPLSCCFQDSVLQEFDYKLVQCGSHHLTWSSWRCLDVYLWVVHQIWGVVANDSFKSSLYSSPLCSTSVSPTMNVWSSWYCPPSPAGSACASAVCFLLRSAFNPLLGRFPSIYCTSQLQGLFLVGFLINISILLLTFSKSSFSSQSLGSLSRLSQGQSLFYSVSSDWAVLSYLFRSFDLPHKPGQLHLLTWPPWEMDLSPFPRFCWFLVFTQIWYQPGV